MVSGIRALNIPEAASSLFYGFADAMNQAPALLRLRKMKKNLDYPRTVIAATAFPIREHKRRYAMKPFAPPSFCRLRRCRIVPASASRNERICLFRPPTAALVAMWRVVRL